MIWHSSFLIDNLGCLQIAPKMFGFGTIHSRCREQNMYQKMHLGQYFRNLLANCCVRNLFEYHLVFLKFSTSICPSKSSQHWEWTQKPFTAPTSIVLTEGSSEIKTWQLPSWDSCGSSSSWALNAQVTLGGLSVLNLLNSTEGFHFNDNGCNFPKVAAQAGCVGTESIPTLICYQ